MSGSTQSGLAAPALEGRAAPVVITGGSGFIGCNVAESFLRDGRDVVILDNLSRPGVRQNLDWLKANYGERVHPLIADIRDLEAIEPVLKEAGAVFHFAAQTAVTTSLSDPFEDFEVNARGTLNILETLRRAGRRTPVIFASTNKVYGALEDLEMMELDDSCMPISGDVQHQGISESRSLSFCTPYGCSKGVADQYMVDYAASFGIPTAVLRMSCVYGPRQFGTEDQGWVAHFLIRALEGEPITVFGNGKQVRDILHVADAVTAYRLVLDHIDTAHGQVFNLGGGMHNAVSLRIVLQEIRHITGLKPAVEWADWRPGDQHYFVSDTARLRRQFGWSATIGWREGLRQLFAWLRDVRGLGRSSEEERLTA
ncbi:NAD-dependent epimerase/dehydratase family protein [Chelativorans sp. YIM 93263]|uniref:NAD-dependent epimerase/dehydratase family protein n=1 Tax=Chelativorans sp. YIM 93263 TaxID=2906648 RepID=UPI002378B011|nr:NAD-dependent epimerase/dehydratase family protein [Chelativorans sp. YIM 93263]